MDKSDVITLIKSTREQDEYGRWIQKTTSREVYCQIDSITQMEFFEGGRNGLNPEFRITMFLYDYKDETIVGSGYREAQLSVTLADAHGDITGKTVTVRLSNGDRYTIDGTTGAVTKQ